MTRVFRDHGSLLSDGSGRLWCVRVGIEAIRGTEGFNSHDT
jgi:hypothetical protein